jgi:steroid delta-isomerase-like uncharacterized protein
MSAAHDTPQKAAFRRFQDATNTHNEELISKTVDEVFQPDVVLHIPVPGQATGAQAIKEIFSNLHLAFPDLHVTIEDLIEEGDKVASRNTVRGTHQGEHMGLPPTGKSITYNEIFIFRFANGRIVETWGVVDVLSQMRQLGLIQA